MFGEFVKAAETRMATEKDKKGTFEQMSILKSQKRLDVSFNFFVISCLPKIFKISHTFYSH